MVKDANAFSALPIAGLIFIPISIASFYGHDWQRVDQISIFFLCVLALGVKLYSQTLSGLTVCFPNGYFFLVLLLGLFSSLRAHQPEWALVEVAVFVGSSSIFFYFANLRASGQPCFDRYFISLITLLCAVKAFQFFVSTVAAYTGSAGIIDADQLIEGFSNKRFYGQFQTFTLPLLALPLLCDGKIRLKSAVFFLLSFWWLIAICGGTRGTWLGIAVATAVVSLSCGARGRSWAVWQIASFGVGLLFFWLLFVLLPDYLHIKIANFAGERLSTSLSARDVLWHQALEMIKEKPWLGYGPMHFADLHNAVAAHPHQVILQWACEWGIPSMLLMIVIVGRGLFATFTLIRQKIYSSHPVDVLRICLFASLTAALVQSMIDGVIVMPYSQLWLALVGGWLMGIHEHRAHAAPPKLLRFGWFVVVAMAAGLLIGVVIRDFPILEAREAQYGHDFGGSYQPRFWRQGVIATGSTQLFEVEEGDSFPKSSPK